MKKRLAGMFLAFMLIIMPFAGCTAQDAVGTTVTETSSALQIDSTYFTDRDSKVDYEESTASKIVLSSTTAKISGDGAKLEDKTVKITKEGTYILSGSSDGLNVVVEAADTEKVWLVFDNISMKGVSAPIQVLTVDKVFITLATGSKNTIEDIDVAENEELNAAIYSKSDLTINGSGKLIVNGKYEHGIKSSDDLKMLGGSFVITAANDGLNANDALNIKDSVIEISAKGDGIHSDKNVYIDGKSLNIKESEEGIEGKVVDIASGDIDIKSSDDGINATDSSLKTDTLSTATSQTADGKETLNKNIKNRQIPPEGFDKMPANFEDLPADVQEKIKNRPERPEGEAVPEGEMQRPEGMPHGAGFENQEGTEIMIRGGDLYIDASGDGIDSNGNLTVSGGKVVIEGSGSRGDGAIDYNGTGLVKGGEVLALGGSDMLQSFSSESAQSHIVVTAKESIAVGAKITIKDEAGKILYEHINKKAFSALVYSSKDLVKAKNYTVQIGDTILETISK
ncbi:carbohydrate-binding domain-containing protein [Acetoanaerobium sticklandii]|uniref:carbohydrate-binding domain-containing protein n=1 Tax=Acetoanaerobium sticklandii TaxID=1511 RepID=UPI003A915385